MHKGIRIAVVDDLPGDREALRDLLLSYAGQLGDPWDGVDCFAGGEAFLAWLVPGRYQVVFLDIVMGDMDGMEVARRLRAVDPAALRVFVTTEAGYALDGYELEAAGFLLKTEQHLQARFARLMERLERKLAPQAALELWENGLPLHVPVEGILYAESDKHYLRLQLQTGSHTLRMALEELAGQLAPYPHFFVCHRGVLVNLDRIQSIERQTVVMENGHSLPVSRRRYAELEQAYAARAIARAREG